MRNPTGYASVVGAGVGHADPGLSSLDQWGECDTYTCKHCNKIVHVPVRADPADIGGLCKQCYGLICPQCLSKGNCTPWEAQMERMEAREAALRSYNL